MLGISERHFGVEGYRNVPETIQNQLNQDVEVFGDFLVCPFTRAKAGEMQSSEEGESESAEASALTSIHFVVWHSPH
jgi:hypothetical protein